MNIHSVTAYDEWSQHHVGRSMPRSSNRGRGRYVVLLVMLLVALALIPLAMRSRGSVADPPAGTLSPLPQRPVTVFIGDSSVAGAGASTEMTRWSAVASRTLDWEEVNLAQRGRGYSPGTSKSCDISPSCRSYSKLVPDVIRAAPQLVVVGGGGNAASTDRAEQAAQVSAFYQSLRLGLPSARIIAVGPWSGTDKVSKATNDLDAAIKSSAGAVGATYVSLLSPPLVDDLMTTRNGMQLNDLGHQAIAGRLVTDLDDDK